MDTDLLLSNGAIIEGEKIEQVTSEIFKVLAQNNLNYEASEYVLNNVKNILGSRCFIKDFS